MAGKNDPGDPAMMDFPVRGTRAPTPMNVQAFLAMLRERGGGLSEYQSSPLALQRQQALAQALRSGRMGPGGGRSKLPVMPL